MNSFFKYVSLGLLSCSAYALSSANFPDTFHIKEFKCATQCFELRNTENEELIGLLVPDTEKKGTYLFKDNQEQTQIIIQYAGSYGSALSFNAYDNHGRFLSRFLSQVNHFTDGSIMSLILYELDWHTIKSQIYSNVLGTSHGLYNGGYSYEKPELAHFTRPIFSWKTDSLVRIVDREQLFSVLDPNLFAALAAFDCLTKPNFEIDPEFRKLQTKAKNLFKAYPANKKSIDLKQLQSISDLLNERFQEQYQDVVLSPAEKIQKFVVFVCELVQSHVLTAEEEYATIQYLKKYMKL